MQERRAHIDIDTDVCQGLGYCERLAPQIFTVDRERGFAVAAEWVAGELVELVESAEVLCPTRAISLRLVTDSADNPAR